MSDPHSAYVQWSIRADGEEARSPHCAYEAGWHARDEKARQEKDDLREILDEHRKALRACKEERDRKTAERSELRRERDRERARAEAAELRVRGYKEEIIPERNRLVTALACYTSGYDGGALARWALGLGTDPAASEAMRETERADGGGEELGGKPSEEMETRLRQAEEAERDFYRRQGKL
jgi:chromosome segregation ATPase